MEEVRTVVERAEPGARPAGRRRGGVETVEVKGAEEFSSPSLAESPASIPAHPSTRRSIVTVERVPALAHALTPRDTTYTPKLDSAVVVAGNREIRASAA